MASATRYDDGGYSGGSMDRPGLRALLADVSARKVDVVVVYKVDRLTRALGDFARIVETLDGAGASFVSVTQAFNTTTSMGRLTLNVLLSFAQFEREVTGERIRDKIAASKRKGMWMGGTLPLGYDAPTDLATRALVVNEAEAATVRNVFERYLALGSVHRLAAELASSGMVGKVTMGRDGQPRGGKPLGRGALLHMLRNRTYLGEIPHGPLSHPGAHPPIVPVDLFERVQAQLGSANGAPGPGRPSGAPLAGIIWDADGARMSPTHAVGRGWKRYRYYVSPSCTRGSPQGDASVRRVSAPALEALLASRLSRHVGRPIDLRELANSNALLRVDVLGDSVVLEFAGSMLPLWQVDPHASWAGLLDGAAPDERFWRPASSADTIKCSLQVRARFCGGRTEFVGVVRTRPRRDRALIAALKKAHARMEALVDGQEAEPIRKQYDRNLIGLACLAPDIQLAILEGRQPPGLTLQRLVSEGVPCSWAEQRLRFGAPC